ncbi:MAG: Protoheme IX farnesyltransferase, mitochondrial [Alyxoria varia]|nr:MAG: Protoheme IX farnesyltransferase, mitochondrial [Alyxoria varia]
MGSFTSATTSLPSGQHRVKEKYFWANEFWNLKGSSERSSTEQHANSKTEGASILANPHRLRSVEGADAVTRISERAEVKDGAFPHRRRKRIREDGVDSPYALPPDASSQLSRISSGLPNATFRQRCTAYLALSKPRLTFLMVLTTASAYTLFPVSVTLFSASADLSPLTLLNLVAGTSLSSACANSLNMLLEPAYDAKMTRTRTRPIVRGLVSSRAALIFAVITGFAGVALLEYGVNPTVAMLSAANIAIYAGIYTPLKRIHVVNTWVGAIVGGIPPLMGWAAAAGQAAHVPEPTWRDLLFSSGDALEETTSSAGGWLLAGLLFAWQFPHFNAIAYTIRHEYAAAGYRMLASFNARKNALIALRYSLAMFPICFGLCAAGVTGWSFAATSSVVNVWMTKEAWRFWKLEGAKGSARALFWASVWQMPLVLVLAMIQKKGLWERFVQGGLSDEELKELQEESYEDEGEVVVQPRALASTNVKQSSATETR